MPWKKSEPMEQRVEFVLRALRAENFRALCLEYGISAKTGYKWQERFLCFGMGGMEEESRRPISASYGPILPRNKLGKTTKNRNLKPNPMLPMF
jgi:hypothetical protein